MRRMRVAAFAACVALLPLSAQAQGHMLHGVGPVNSAMGGAGTALPNESLGALMFNPALISGADGNQISFGTEFFKDGIRITTTAGVQTGVEVPDNQLGVIPAFGWMYRAPDRKMAIGFGLLGIAGFRTDYFQDNRSILFAQPPAGFGRIYTDLRVTKIPVAFSFQVTPKLAIGASLNTYLGEFAVAPLPHKVFDVSPNGDRWYPEAGNLDQSWAVSGQFGLLYDVSSSISLGASLTTPQNFGAYEWNSTIADPASPDFGKARTLDFELDGPLIVSFGGAFKGRATQVAIDGMYTKYEGVEGFGSPGGIVDRIVYPFGWRNVWTFKAGLQQQAGSKLVVRGGYNYSQMPLRDEVVLTATGAPATFQHHFSGGIGVKIFPFLEADASFYFVPRQSVKGPFPTLDGDVIGTIDESNKLTSGLIGLNFRF